MDERNNSAWHNDGNDPFERGGTLMTQGKNGMLSELRFRADERTENSAHKARGRIAKELEFT